MARLFAVSPCPLCMGTSLWTRSASETSALGMDMWPRPDLPGISPPPHSLLQSQWLAQEWAHDPHQPTLWISALEFLQELLGGKKGGNGRENLHENRANSAELKKVGNEMPEGVIWVFLNLNFPWSFQLHETTNIYWRLTVLGTRTHKLTFLIIICVNLEFFTCNWNGPIKKEFMLLNSCIAI